mgnify:CR=1 FL=1
MEYYDKISLAADTLITRLAGRAPTVGIILGSGWGSIVERAKNAVEIPYSDIPGMAVSTVPGHAGKWICGEVGGKTVLIMSGRLHAYEGHELRDIVMPVYMMKKAGVGTLIVTNAAGAVNESYKAGDMMIISDHINFASLNPLRGANDDRLGTRFPDMSAAYDGELTALAASVAAECGVCAHRGVYHRRSELRDPRRDTRFPIARRGRGRHVYRARGHSGTPCGTSRARSLVYDEYGGGRASAAALACRGARDG